MTHEKWAEKYRPTTIDDLFLPTEVREKLKPILESKAVPHLILAGHYGTGKTTLAHLLASTIGLDKLFINTPLHASLDLLRDEVELFVSKVSLSGQKKLVVFDEATEIRPESRLETFFASLRPMMEKYAANSSFVFTTNSLSKIPEQISSRSQTIAFDVLDVLEYQKDMGRRAVKILDTEGVKYDKNIVWEAVKRHTPDMRAVINCLQQYRTRLTDESVVAQFSVGDLDELVEAMRVGNAKKARELVLGTHVGLDGMYTKLWQVLQVSVRPESLDDAILILGDWQKWHALAADKEIHIVALVTDLMRHVKWI